MDFDRIPKTHAGSHEDFDYYVREEAKFYHFVDDFNLVGTHWGEPQLISAGYFLRLLMEGSSARAHYRQDTWWSETDEHSEAFRKYYTPLLDHGAMWRQSNGGVICSAMPYGEEEEIVAAFLEMVREFQYPDSIKMQFLDDAYRFRPNGDCMIIIYYDASQEEFDPNLSERELRQKAIRHSAPGRYRSSSSGSFVRDQYVKEYAKRRAHGVCQLCDQPAPFVDRNGRPYLEAHHVIWLDEGGDDSIDNVVALCPNCHRKMHHLNLDEDVQKLLQVARSAG
jgi:5-methylcytosine-specific restriction endonuclease McrA